MENNCGQMIRLPRKGSRLFVLLQVLFAACFLTCGFFPENLPAQSKTGFGLFRSIHHPVKPPSTFRLDSENIHLTISPMPGIEPTSLRIALNQVGFHSQTHLGGLVTVTGPTENLPDLLILPEVKWVDSGPADSPLMNTSRSGLMSGSDWIGTWTDSVHASGLTGENTLIGVVDDGFSINSGDYQTPSGASRIAWIWNQGTNTPGRYPTQPSYSYGTEWSASDIDASLVTGLPGSSHGSVCLSIAASDGSQSGIKGMAPSAGIILVIRKPGSTLSNTVDAFNYIQKKAKAMNQPVAISYSLGSQFGPHDGTKLHELAIDSLSGSGVVFAVAAGNSGGQAIHLTGSIPSTGLTDSVRLTINSNDQTTGKAFAVNNWFPPEDSIDVWIKSPSGFVYGPFIRKETYDTLSTPDGFLYVQNQFDPVSNLVGIDWELINYNNRKVKTGQWTVYHHTRFTQSGGTWDGWVYLSTIPGSVQTRVNTERTLTMPATSRESIAAGAYEKGTGARQGSSSTGPTRDGRMKPEVAAPSNVNSGAGSLGGTSASAPHVAGMAALLFQADPTLTPDQIKELIETGSRSDSQTGVTPNNAWGYGKLNSYYTALAQNPGLPVEIASLRAYRNSNFLMITWQVIRESGIAGYSINAGSSRLFHFSDQPSLLATGKATYYFQVKSESLPAQTNLTLQAIGMDGKVHGEMQTLIEDRSDTPVSFLTGPPFPNPGNPSVKLPVTAFTETTLELTLMSVTGQQVSKMRVSLEPGNQVIGLATDHLASGFYLLRVSDSHLTHFFRIVVVK